MTKQDLYEINYQRKDGTWYDVTAKTKEEGIILYDALADMDCKFKCLFDRVSGDYIRYGDNG